MRSLLVLFSYHHKNTEKIAKVFTKILDAPIKTSQQINLEELQEYNLIGFGSGIYSAKHHKLLTMRALALLALPENSYLVSPLAHVHLCLF